MLAARRRAVRDAPAGLHGTPGPTRVDEVEPRHVPRAARAATSTSRTARCGLHYQIHRGIGVHHAAAVRRGERLRVNVIVGGPPALAVAAVMPLPEGLPELAFAGALGGRRLRLVDARAERASAVSERRRSRLRRLSPALPCPPRPTSSSAGWIDPTRTKPEGPFGDHLGYYSLAHDFPVMTVEAVYHRPGAIWPFTVVGRPPQEDTTFGELIHELTGPVIPTVIPGRARGPRGRCGRRSPAAAGDRQRAVRAVRRHAAPAGTAHARERDPRAGATVAGEVPVHRGEGGRAGPRHPRHRRRSSGTCWSASTRKRDLHFQTRTTIDTLDYSAGMGLNAGSKLVIAAAGPKRRDLGTTVPPELRLPDGFSRPAGGAAGRAGGPRAEVRRASRSATTKTRTSRGCAPRSSLRHSALGAFPLVVVVDDSEFVAANAEQLPVGGVHAIATRRTTFTAWARSRSASTGAVAGRW